MPEPTYSGSSQPAHPERPPGRLALQDGSVYQGEAFGATGRGIVSAAEVVFNTAMCGYQESLTDPSYAGQILVATFPLIGNYGTNGEDIESPKVQVAGFIVRELARRPSNFRSTGDLSSYLAHNGVLGLTGVDTRAITRRLRTTGVMQGIMTDRADLSDAELVGRARRAPDMSGQNLVPLVGCSTKSSWTESLGEWGPSDAPAGTRFKVIALDCGAKRNILRNLSDRGCEVTVVPHTITAQEVRDLRRQGKADGLFISNGPGDPAAVEATINTLSSLVGPTAGADAMPTFGICLGHQLLALALGAKTYKLKFGHRGANQPVLNQLTGEVEITSQNHGFAVDPVSLEAVGGEPTHINLNDGTLAGFRMKDRPVFAVQHHPEASPGPHDAGYLFDAFVTMMGDKQAPTGQSMRRHQEAPAG
jgi:carbamoyl-phosphate synthase small subunit